MAMTKDLVDVIMENEGLIYSIIKRYKDYYAYEDLYQVGVIGIIRAYQNYDSSYETKFSTYAYPFILGEVRRYLREDKSLKVTRGLYKLNYQIERAREMLCQKLMREPTILELSLYLEVDEKTIEMAAGINNMIYSLDEPINSDGKELNLYDSIKSEEALDVTDKLYLYEEINRLPQKEQKLLNLRYLRDKTQAETASVLGISQVQVSREEQKVLKKLRQTVN
ncbi:MAG: sigma-70 family RNA polymerase sigma factor [Bacilli bacterium]|nr:sigma-70 family RNA polymerase sigma factor [Bacilli bacterium]